MNTVNSKNSQFGNTYKILPLNYHPQQNTFEFDMITLSSEFDSGNMLNASKVAENCFSISISPDCQGITQEYVYKTWFHFKAISSNKLNKKLYFKVENMNNYLKLFQDGYKILYYIVNSRDKDIVNEVYQDNSDYYWKRLEGEIKPTVIFLFLY